MSAAPAIGVDIGGTKVLAALVDPEGRIVARERRQTPRGDTDAALGEIAALIDAVRATGPGGAAPRDIGIGIAGLVDLDQDAVLLAPNIEWTPGRLGSAIAERTGLATMVVNDARAAAWGEVIAGAGRGLDDVVVVTVGTGIGGGLVLGGRLRHGASGLAGEVGHLPVEADGRACRCGARGCWEAYASGTALVEQARRSAAADPGRARVLLALADGSAAGIEGPMVTEAARAGDPVALAALAECARWLGIGLAGLVTVLDPQAVILGGGLSADADLLIPGARAAMEDRLIGARLRPPVPILTAELGNDAGVVGAAALARDRRRA